MAQKDKVKELVGRSLNSYHTKSLQQIDRIEKKNKEQNHKISILSNELDNDYLTKTEEGSVVSLEHSKEGMVYLDELQGNTLVNYCTDGSKEMTLNGDIDVEGTFVTTTEGVDNGKVDVMCEGNTLVNLIKQVDGFTYTHYPLTIGEIYTMIVEFTSNSVCDLYIEENITWANLSTTSISGVKKGYNKFVVKLTIPSNYIGTEKINITNRVNGTYDGNVKFTDVKPLLLKGDYTNREIPSEHFEGMKSVGQDDVNGHKIEILSQNKNLLKNPSLATKTSWDVFNGTIVDGVNGNKGVHSEYVTTPEEYYNFLEQLIFSKGSKNNIIKTDRWYTFSFYAKGTGKVRTHIYPNTIDTTQKGIVDGVEKTLLADGNCDWNLTDDWVKHTYTFKSKSDLGIYSRLLFRLMPSGTDTLNTATISCPMLEEGKVATNFVDNLSNKKEILINEPLRKLPNGKKDQIVKINNKYFIERNCVLYTFDGSENWKLEQGTTPFISIQLQGIKHTQSSIICDKLPVRKDGTDDMIGAERKNICGIQSTNTTETIRIRVGDLSHTLEGSKTWLANNNVSAIFELARPTYEPLEIEPVLNVYNDITHISNNSIIPCNMKIKNSGYNAIIKPSTLYTVALDTNKSGTIGMNLGGAKVTTTNNVAKITTPATLTDDSLRLYGKGIKGSKVRLLEGDKTNWIPSHFEGMKSSFEDKLQEDGTYKMEILSNNQNLFDRDKTYYRAGWGEQNYQKYKNGFSFCSKDGWNSIGYTFESLKNKTVTVCATVTCVNKDASKQQEQPFSIIPVEYGYPTSVRFRDGETKKVKFNITLKDNGRVYFIGASNNEGSHKGGIQWFLEDISVVEGIENDYVPRECNKIQFSSIEPLRGVDNIKDKFVFKDGRLMIERNCSKYTTVGTENWIRHDYSNSNKIFAYAHVTSMNDRKAYTNIYCNNFATYLKSAEELRNQNNEYIWKGNDAHSVLWLWISNNKFDGVSDINKFKTWIKNNPITVTYQLAEPTYEEIPFELQKIILEGYENGTLFFDTNIPPTSTITYAGETPIVKSVKLNKTEVLNNTNDINDNIIPYLMDMDYQVVMLQLATEELEGGVSMARLFGGTYEMIKRDILSKRLTREEYGYRLADYFNAGKLTEEQVRELEELR